MPSILFICTANICRSPLAAAVFQTIVAERLDAGEWRIESAGTWGIDGQPAADGSITVAAEYGENLRSHRARTANRKLVHQFDLIVTMEAGHKEALKLEFPEIRSRVIQLSELVGQLFDVPDPMGQGIDQFRYTAREFDRIMRYGMGKIEELVRKIPK